MIEPTGAGRYHAGTVVGGTGRLGYLRARGTPRGIGDSPTVMDSAHVAEMLGLPSIKTVQVLVRKRRVPALRLPGARRYWFLRDEIVEWLQSDETKGNPQYPTTLIVVQDR